jgi:multicomponent Na+:H+ antiporter subunit D
MGDDKVRINEQATVLLLGVICFAGGLFGAQFIRFLFDVEVYVDAAGHLEKAALYLASALNGFLIYRFYVQKSSSLKRIRNFDLGFRTMCIATGGFFAAVMLYLNLS